MNSVVHHADSAIVFSEDFFAPANTDKVDFLIGQYTADRQQIERVAAFMHQEAKSVLAYFTEGNCGDQRYTLPGQVDKLFNVEGAIAALNADYWDRALRMTDVLDSMPQKRREDWFEQIHQRKTPEFEEGAVRDTLLSLLASRATFFAERVDGVFRALSRDHVTNRPEAFGKRMILPAVLDSFGFTNHVDCGHLNDLRAVIARFHGQDEPGWNSAAKIVSIAAKRPGEWCIIDGGALRLRVYKKGTGHVEVHPDMAWKLNAVLASLYPTAIPSQYRQKPKKGPKAFAEMQTHLPFQVLNVVGEIISGRGRDDANKVRLPYSVIKDNHILKRKTGELLEMLGGVLVDPITYSFDYNPYPALEGVLVTGTIPDKQAYQYYPTPERLAERAVALTEIDDHHRCLEPSAGQGGLAAFMPQERTLCIELSALRATILAEKGFEVQQADFLAWASSATQVFDRIVMNPPFADNRARLHLEAAASLLAPAGRLVAILPASYRGKDLLPGFELNWTEVLANEFQGTSISVVMLVAERPAA